jgi:hypothetical protein
VALLRAADGLVQDDAADADANADPANSSTAVAAAAIMAATAHLAGKGRLWTRRPDHQEQRQGGSDRNDLL